MDSSQSNHEQKQLPRDYKCPCGKSYLSNAAIFTHIKHKHGGVAPGPIEKPKLVSRPRGRPPLSTTNKNTGNLIKVVEMKEKIKEEISENHSYYQSFKEIFSLLNEIQNRQQFNPQIWQNVQTFKRMQEFIEWKKKPVNFRYEGTCIGIGISQFLKEMSQGLSQFPWRFQQILILFILLLQYAIDENNRPQIIEEAPIQFLIDSMNPFIKDHIQDYAQYLAIDHLWIMKQQNMTRVFLCFYHWLKSKNYTQYCITLV